MKKIIAFISLITLLTGCSSLETLNAIVPDGDATLTSNVGYGLHARQRLDIHQPAAPYTKAPVIIFFYGGRWQSGSRHDYQFVGKALAKRGFITVIPDYRLFPEVEFPEFIADGAKATQWVLENIPLYGGDPSRVILMGYSSGAHLGAMLVTDKKFLAEQHVSIDQIHSFIGLSGPYDFNITDDDIQQVFRKAPSHDATQPVHFIDGSEPPMLLLHGYKDTIVLPKNSLSMASTAIKHGGRAELVIYEDLAHVGTLLALADTPFLYVAPVLEDIERFIHCTSDNTYPLSTCFANKP